MTLQTEKAIQEGLQTLLQTISELSKVTINDDTFLDDSLSQLPVAMVQTAESADLRPAPGRVVGTYQMPVALYVEYIDWQESNDAIRDIEQKIVSKANDAGAIFSANGLEGVNITAIRIDPIVDIKRENDPDGLPVILIRPITFEVELF